MVAWKGYDSNHNSWEPEGEIHALLLADYARDGPPKAQVGQEFEQEGTIYQLFRMFETVGATEVSSVACAYFEVEQAKAAGLTLDYFLSLSPDLERTNFEELGIDYLQVSYHGLVMDWIQDSDLPLPPPPPDGSSLGCRRSSRVVSAPPTKVSAVNVAASPALEDPVEDATAAVVEATDAAPVMTESELVPWKIHPDGGAWSSTCTVCKLLEAETDSADDTWLQCW